MSFYMQPDEHPLAEFHPVTATTSAGLFYLFSPFFLIRSPRFA